MSRYDFPPALKFQGSNESIASAFLVSDLKGMSHYAQKYRFNSYGKLCYGDTILSTNWSLNEMKQLPQDHRACTWPSWEKYSHWTAKLGFFHLMLINCPILPSPMVHKQRAKQGNQNIDNLLGTALALWKTVQKGREHMAIGSLFQLHQWKLLTTLWEPGKSTQRVHFLGYLLRYIHLPKTLGTGPWVLAWATQCSCLLTVFSYDLVNFPASCFTANYPMTPCQSMRTLPRNRL